MLTTIKLSESAVAVLRFRIKGLRIPVRERDLRAYRELAAAGIMEPLPDAMGNPEADFRFLEDGWAQREELLAEAQDRCPSRLGPNARQFLRVVPGLASVS